MCANRLHIDVVLLHSKTKDYEDKNRQQDEKRRKVNKRGSTQDEQGWIQVPQGRQAFYHRIWWQAI